MWMAIVVCYFDAFGGPVYRADSEPVEVVCKIAPGNKVVDCCSEEFYDVWCAGGCTDEEWPPEHVDCGTRNVS